MRYYYEYMSKYKEKPQYVDTIMYGIKKVRNTS